MKVDDNKRIKEMATIHPIYTNGPHSSYDLREVCRRCSSLTFDSNSPTGFKEITIITPEKVWNPEHSHLLTKKMGKEKADPQKIINTIKDFFLTTWDSNDVHLLKTSGGRDSRIIARILKTMEKEEGKDWLGEFHLVCHQPEEKIFKAAMKEMGWKPEQYYVHKEDAIEEPDYYDYGDFDINANAFFPQTFGFWSERISKDMEKDTVIINGSMSNRLLDTRYSKSTNIIFRNFYRSWPNVYASNIAFRFKISIDPYASYKMLDLVSDMHVPKSRHDNIRKHICSTLKDDKVPYSINTGYNFSLSQKKKNLMRESFIKSKLYEKYPEVRDKQTWKHNVYDRTIDGKVYGLATMFEGV